MSVHDPIFIRLTERQSKILNDTYHPGGNVYAPSNMMPELDGKWTLNEEELTFDEWEVARKFAKWAREQAPTGKGHFKRSMNALAKKIEKAIEFPTKMEQRVKSDGWIPVVSSGANKSVLNRTYYQRFEFKGWEGISSMKHAVIVDKVEDRKWRFQIGKYIHSVGFEPEEDEEDVPDGFVVDPDPPYTAKLVARDISPWETQYGFELPEIKLHQDDKEKSAEMLPSKLMAHLIAVGIVEAPTPICSCGSKLLIVAQGIGWCDSCKEHLEVEF